MKECLHHHVEQVNLVHIENNIELLIISLKKAPYVAPEVLSKNEYKAQPTDVWSCGIVLVAMLAGELPWDKPIFECTDFVQWIKNNSYQKTPWCKIENSALSLIRNILTYDPAQRFTIKQIKQSTWFAKTHKNVHYDSVSSVNLDSFLSQPTYFYINEANNSTTMGPMAEIQFTDSQQNCECSQMPASQICPKTPFANNTAHHFESFSQPISTEHMILNSQIQVTQNPNSQFGSQYASASQSPLLKLVKRMTRMFVHSSTEACTQELKKIFDKCMYEYKIAITNQRQRQITVSTSDKRQTLLTFKVNILEMHSQNEVLLDFRLSKGDGLEFKKIFMKIKSSLSHIVCKRYVFTNNFKGCCDRRV